MTFEEVYDAEDHLEHVKSGVCKAAVEEAKETSGTHCNAVDEVQRLFAKVVPVVVPPEVRSLRVRQTQARRSPSVEAVYYSRTALSRPSKRKSWRLLNAASWKIAESSA